MQVGTTKDQGLYNNPSAAVHPGALAAGTLPQYNTEVRGDLVEALRYKSEGRRFDSRWDSLDFSLTHFSGPISLRNRLKKNDYQGYILGAKGGRCARLNTYICRWSGNPGSLDFLDHRRACPVF